MDTFCRRLRTLLSIFVICLTMIGGVKSVKNCTRTDVCKCTSDEGVIDLSALDSKSGKPGFDGMQLSSDKTWIYSYNPCTPYTEPTTGKTDCKGVAVCQYASDPTKDETYPLGLHQGNTFTVVSGKVVVSYKETGPDQKLRTTKVTLICDKGVDRKMVFNGETTLVYNFQLTSKYVCPGGGGGGGGGGISTGSILCILLVVFILVYLVAGMLFMTVRRGATGVERIPNVAFWKELPLLIKDGFFFVIKCGKGGAGYNEI